MALKPNPLQLAWLIVAVGVAVITAGIALLSVPLALIVAGTAIVAYGLLGTEVTR